MHACWALPKYEPYQALLIIPTWPWEQDLKETHNFINTTCLNSMECIKSVLVKPLHTITVKMMIPDMKCASQVLIIHI